MRVRGRAASATPGRAHRRARAAHCPRRDRFIGPALLEGLEDWASHTWRRPVEGHWVVRTHPDDVARWVGEVAAAGGTGAEPDGLRRLHVTGS